jgi:hypothetical protein
VVEKIRCRSLETEFGEKIKEISKIEPDGACHQCRQKTGIK